MKKIISILFQVFFIIFPIILIPLNFIFGYSNQYIVLINNKNESEINKLLSDYTNTILINEKELIRLKYNDYGNYSKLTLYYSDNTESYINISGENLVIKNYIKNNYSFSGIIFMVITDIIFLIFSLILIIKNIIVYPIKNSYKKNANKTQNQIKNFSNIDIQVYKEQKLIYKGNIEFANDYILNMKYKKKQDNKNEIIFYI